MYACRKIIATVWLLLGMASIAVSGVLAEAQSISPSCESHRWPFAQAVDQIKIQDLEKMDRVSLYSYLYFELSQPTQGRIKGLAKKLMFFLKNTELNNDRALMLEAVEFAAGLDSSSPNVLAIEELCRIDRKAASVPVPAKGTNKGAKKRK